jgi:predicted Rossmann fold flavoprotein
VNSPNDGSDPTDEQPITVRKVLGEVDVAVIGAGCAGLAAAIGAGLAGVRTLLIEKNPKPAKKLTFRSGGKRILTSLLPPDRFLSRFGKGASFLRPALRAFPGNALVGLLQSHGAETEVVSGTEVVPKGGRLSDVAKALLQCAQEQGVEVKTGFAVDAVEAETEGGRTGFFVRDRVGTGYRARKVIVSAGGISYPETGSTGDGYQWARDLGHEVVPPAPALVGLVTKGLDTQGIEGVVVEDVEMTLLSAQFRAPLAIERGSIKFTESGIAGPAALNLSVGCATVGRGQNLVLRINFFPGVSLTVMQSAIERRISENPQKKIVDVLARETLPKPLPTRLLEALVVASFPGLKNAPCAKFPIATRRLFAERLVGFELEIVGTEGFRKAHVTDGGVALAEIDPETMESKFVPGLYFAGEIIDLTGRIGGYNIQAAFSTGFLAGIRSAATAGGKKVDASSLLPDRGAKEEPATPADGKPARRKKAAPKETKAPVRKRKAVKKK